MILFHNCHLFCLKTVFSKKKKKKKKVVSGAPCAARSNPNASQGFIWNEITWPPGLLEKKNNNNKVVSFRRYFLCLHYNVDNRQRARASF